MCTQFSSGMNFLAIYDLWIFPHSFEGYDRHFWDLSIFLKDLYKATRTINTGLFNHFHHLVEMGSISRSTGKLPNSDHFNTSTFYSTVYYRQKWLANLVFQHCFWSAVTSNEVAYKSSKIVDTKFIMTHTISTTLLSCNQLI